MRHSRITITGQKVLILGLMLGLLSSCIRPVDETTVTATPDFTQNISNGGGSGITITPPSIATLPSSGNDGLPPGIQVTDLPSIEAFILSQGHTVSSGTLEVWQTISIGGTEIIIGFSYTNPSSLPCIGLVIADRGVADILNVYNGESTCATELGTPAIAGNWFLVTNNSPTQPLTATVGEMFNPSAPVTSASIVYSDGTSSIAENVQNNRFLAARTDSTAGASIVIFNNEFGNAEAQVNLNP